MPYTVFGNSNGYKAEGDIARTDYGYKYPLDTEGRELNLRPGSELHDKIKNRLLEMANHSHAIMSRRYDAWNEIDRTLTTFIHTDDKEDLVKEKDPRRPISIVFPHSYAIKETLLTYLTMAFMQDPIFQYEGVGPEDVQGTMLLEQVVKVHTIKTKVFLALHTIFSDNLSYGLGAGLPGWLIRKGKKLYKGSVALVDEYGNTIQNQTEKTWVDSVLFEGNKLDAIDPYRLLLDPNVPVHEQQKGTFIGWLEESNYVNMLSEEQDGGFFNTKYLELVKGRRSQYSTDKSKREEKAGGPAATADLSTVTHQVDNIWLYVKLIPKEWGLGKREVPQKWLFCLSNDCIVTRAEQLDHAHNMFPISICASDFDGHSTTPISRMEVLYGMQGILDWFLNSHVANVRKSLNDMWLVDPYMININDIMNPGPGKIIRLNRPAWGRGVKDFIMQFPVSDITRQNVGDASIIMSLMDRVAGADQSMSGALRQGGPERLTRDEFRGTRMGGISRLQRIAMVIGAQFMQDIAYMFACHTQQYMTEATYVSVLGRYQEQLEGLYGSQRIHVTPDDLAIDYDVIPRDGSIPGGNFSESWIQLYNIIMSNPELIQGYDTFRIFTYIATQLGAKNIDDFRRKTGNVNTQVMPDQQVAQQVQAGNLVAA